MSENNKVISPELFGFTSDEKARFIDEAYTSLADLRRIPLPAGLTQYDIADAFLDTLSNYVDMGPIEHDDLVSLIRDTVEQLDDEGDL